MGNPVTKWISDDGLSFEDECSMLLHELSLLDAKEIDLFVKQFKDRKQKEYAAVLNLWQKYQRSHQNTLSPVKQTSVPLSAEELFARIPQGVDVLEPDGYSLEAEEAALEKSFKYATFI